MGGKFLLSLAAGYLIIGIIGFVAYGVPAFIAIQIEVATGFHCFPQRHTGGMMPRVSSPHKFIIIDMQFFAHIFEIRRHFISKFKRLAACVARCLRHFQAVLIGPGYQPNIAPHQPLKPGNRIGGDGFIGMANVRTTIGISNSGGYVIGL